MIDLSFQRGNILNISERINPSTLQSNYGIGFSFKTSLINSSSKQKESRNPSYLGAGFYHESYKNQVFGKSYRFLLLADFFPFQSKHYLKKIAFSFNTGAGFSYFNSKYDALKNQQNVLIGSDITFAFRVEPRLAWNITQQLSIFGGYYLSHASNSDWKLPNIGINNVGFNVGLRYTNLHDDSHLHFKEYHETKDKKYFIDLFASTGLKAIEEGKRNYLVANTHLSISRKLSDFIHINSGLIYEVDWSLIKHMEVEGNESAAIDKLSFVLGTEFNWGKFSLLVKAGRYIYLPYNIFFTKIYQRYLLRIKLNKHVSLFGGLKSHAGKADFGEYGVAYRF